METSPQITYVRSRLIDTGLSRHHANLAYEYILKQVKHQGIYNAIRFLKTIGAKIIEAVTGEIIPAPWVATAYRFPKAFSFLRFYDEKVCLRVAKIYRCLRLKSTNTPQVAKRIQPVLAPYGGSPEAISRVTDLVRLSVPKTKPSIPFDIYKYVPVQYSYCIMHGEVRTQVLPTMQLICNLDVPDHLVGDLFAPLRYGFSALNRSHYTPQPDYRVGKVGYSQEGGGKLRIFASPDAGVNELLNPLSYWLACYLDSLPTDCRKDQSKGAIWAHQHLIDGDVIHSVDLSSATCRFPLKVQLNLLWMLNVPGPVISLFEKIARGRWECHPDLVAHGAPRFVSWSVGQPLGTRPSILLFSLVHNLLLSGICYELGLDPKNSFRVLGDDVVMISALHKRYISLMESMDVPVSLDKSFSSDKVAEFAGYTITKNTMVRAGQWSFATKYNHFSICETLGIPLTEMPLSIKKAELLYLFELGIYTPEPSEYGKFLRANTERLLDFSYSFPKTSAFKSYADCLKLDGVQILSKEDIFRKSYTQEHYNLIDEKGDTVVFDTLLQPYLDKVVTDVMSLFPSPTFPALERFRPMCYEHKLAKPQVVHQFIADIHTILFPEKRGITFHLLSNKDYVGLPSFGERTALFRKVIGMVSRYYYTPPTVAMGRQKSKTLEYLKLLEPYLILTKSILAEVK